MGSVCSKCSVVEEDGVLKVDGILLVLLLL